MKIKDYIKSLHRNFSKKAAREHLDVTRDELVNQTIPVIALIANEPETNFKSKTYKLYSDDLKETIKVNIGKNSIFTSIHKTLLNSVDILNFLDKFYEDKMSEEVTAQSLDLKQSTAVQLTDYVALFTKFSRRLADVILIAEEAHETKQENEVQSLTQADLQFLANNIGFYKEVMTALQIPVSRLQDLLDTIPDLIISEIKHEAALNTHGSTKVNPMLLKFNDSSLNPIWLFVTNISEYQAKRYHLSKQEAEVLELRIQRYKRRLNQTNDPKLAAIIEKREAELDMLRAKLRKMEGKG